MDFFEAIGRVGLKVRDGQVDMALDIAEAFRDQTNIALEASVGIGKSFGYLIPAVLISSLMKRPIILATSSIQLTEQLYSDAIQVGKYLNKKVTPVVGKGKSHYSCLHRAYDYLGRYGNKSVDKRMKEVLEWVLDNQIGDRSKAPFDVRDDHWHNVNVEKCTFDRCHHRSVCHFYRMRNDISDHGECNIVIVNQDLLINDLLRKRTNGGTGFITTQSPLIVIDEAHNMEDKMRSALTVTFSRRELAEIIFRLKGTYTRSFSYKEYEKKLTLLEIHMTDLLKQIAGQMIAIQAKDQRHEVERFPIHFPNSFDKSYCNSVLEDLLVSLSVMKGVNDNEIGEMLEHVEQLQTLITDFYDYSDHLFWGNILHHSEPISESNIAINFCPKNINKILRDHLFSADAKVILTSATLCQPGETLEKKYEYIVSSTGFVGDLAVPKSSDYDYDNNTLLYVANDILPPTEEDEREEYYRQVALRIQELTTITNGRSLVLFTSKMDMTLVKMHLDKMILPWPIEMQREGASQNTTIHNFRRHNGLLLGSGVFWEGIDIKGTDLLQVIIVRLPFPVPDPILEHKMKQVKDRQEVLLPEMLMKLRQGAGRLIRSEEDFGVLSILDIRISSHSKSEYKSKVLDSLQTRKKTEDIRDVMDFFNEKMRDAST